MLTPVLVCCALRSWCAPLRPLSWLPACRLAETKTAGGRRHGGAEAKCVRFRRHRFTRDFRRLAASFTSRTPFRLRRAARLVT
jgi:hypothetical protein